MKHAVIYVPGSNQHMLAQSLLVVAERIAACLKAERADLDDVRVTLVKGDLHLGEASADRVTLEGLADGTWRELVDLYEANYLEAFVARFTEQSSLERAFSAIRIFAGNLGQLGLIFTGRSKGLLDRLQGAFLTSLTIFLALYLVYWSAVAAAAVFGIEAMFEQDASRTGFYAAALAAGSTALGFAFKTWVAKLERSAIEFYALCEYIKDDTIFAESQAMVRDGVVALRRKGYERVDMLCFSMGCLIAGDTLYPRRAGLRRTSDQIDDWITVGYPYDLVKVAYPGYFDDRQAPAVTHATWWNVTEGSDFLGSNFRNDDDNGPPAEDSGIFFKGGLQARPARNFYFAPPKPAVKRSWLDAIVPFRRVSNHGLYWDAHDPFASSCFAPLVQAGFCNPPIAKSPPTPALDAA